jgi:hypothetical protein
MSLMSIKNWLFHKDDEPPSEDDQHGHGHWWGLVLFLCGVDYFSSAAYAPSLSVQAVGYLAPIATLALVALTLLGGVPMYRRAAEISRDGGGSLSIINKMVSGWGKLGWIGKVIMLSLVGFAMVGFLFTITLSAGDAAAHVVENPFMQHLGLTEHTKMWIADLLILALCIVFLRGFNEAIGIAVLLAAPYVLMNWIIISKCLQVLWNDPRPVYAWLEQVRHFDHTTLLRDMANIKGGATRTGMGFLGFGGSFAIIMVVLRKFPGLALGMSGFETGVTLQPLIKGRTSDERAHNTKKLLLAAALIMSTILIGSSFVTTCLVPIDALKETVRDENSGHIIQNAGEASGRALAYLAHKYVDPWLGSWFGTAYDIDSTAILWFAGASAMVALLALIPKFWVKFGMAPAWAEYRRPLIIALASLALGINHYFHADVEAQANPYATGVLGLFTSAAFAVTAYGWKTKPLRKKIFFSTILGVFMYVSFMNMYEKPVGLVIVLGIIGVILLVSFMSRSMRSWELSRIEHTKFLNDAGDAIHEGNHALWSWLKENGQKIVLIPIRTSNEKGRACAPGNREVEEGQIGVYLHISRHLDPSTFTTDMSINALKLPNSLTSKEDLVIIVQDAPSVALAIAYIALQLDVAKVCINLLDHGTPMFNGVMYTLFGEGEFGYSVRRLMIEVNRKHPEIHTPPVVLIQAEHRARSKMRKPAEALFNQDPSRHSATATVTVN